jgi:hypothetical protein
MRFRLSDVPVYTKLFSPITSHHEIVTPITFLRPDKQINYLRAQASQIDLPGDGGNGAHGAAIGLRRPRSCDERRGKRMLPSHGRSMR